MITLIVGAMCTAIGYVIGWLDRAKVERQKIASGELSTAIVSKIKE